jgi:energy-converting hydrogenase Eha subunit C
VVNTVQADAKFLRRIFMTLVVLTLASGGMIGLTAAQAMTDVATACTVSCQ